MVGSAHPTVMSDYRRYFVPGGTYFFTLVTEGRQPLFADESNVELFREAVRGVKLVQPFEINAAVVLPEHVHFIWTLPAGDDQYSKRIGRIKAKLTQLLAKSGNFLACQVSTRASKQKHRERDIWQRRFWEHLIRDEHEFEALFDYIHYNPVKHGLVACPHQWQATSFHFWVANGVRETAWGCQCNGEAFYLQCVQHVERVVGEPT